VSELANPPAPASPLDKSPAQAPGRKRLLAAASFLLRLGLGGLMAYAGVIKLFDTATFAEEIGNYRFLPALAPLASVTVPAIELVAGAGLILLRGGWRRGAALVTLGLLAVFTVAVTSARIRGIDLRCGCFGGESEPVTNLTVVRDLALLGWTLLILQLER
jgi:putative oxidoreductase